MQFDLIFKCMNLIISRRLPCEDLPQKSSARFASLLPVCHKGVEAAQKKAALCVWCISPFVLPTCGETSYEQLRQTPAAGGNAEQ